MRVRLLADDLTGAIDSAVRFVPRTGPFPVVWNPDSALGQGSVALDLGTREGSDAAAEARWRRRHRCWRGRMSPTSNAIPCCAATWRWSCWPACGAGGFARAILAPAFPAQGRVTQNGRQYVRAAGQQTLVGPDVAAQLRPSVAAQLRALGCAVAQCRPGDAPPPGISLWDAATEADLDRIAAVADAPGATLWCGSAGLAAALAGGATAAITKCAGRFSHWSAPTTR